MNKDINRWWIKSLRLQRCLSILPYFLFELSKIRYIHHQSIEKLIKQNPTTKHQSPKKMRYMVKGENNSLQKQKT